MNVKNKTLAQWKKLFSEELVDIYEKREIESVFSLVMEHLGWSKINQLLKKDDLISDEEHLLNEILLKLKNDEPIQYILGYSYFDDLKIPVAPGVLIPRQETEELVDWIDDSVENNTEILDVCLGSGCISLALKNRDASKTITGIEYSPEAIIQAKKNAKELQLEINILEKDALKDWDLNKLWDCIVSNPPYIPNFDKVRMKRNVLDFEPKMALFVEDDNPLIFYRAIAKQGLKYLKPNGFLFFEIHEDLGAETVNLIKELGYNSIELRKDLNGKDRMIKAIKS